MTSSSATAIAHPNIALVKYWGKRDVELNLPAAGSISLTLAGLQTRTVVTFLDEPGEDEIVLDERTLTGNDSTRICEFLDRIRERTGIDRAVRVVTKNDFPTAAGLASSASGFAALALAASHAAGLELEPAELSVLARLGSGSAARSVFGGFVEMHAGERDDGADAYAEQLLAPEHWDLSCLIAVTATGTKKIGSTTGMNRTADTSPYYDAWTESVDGDLAAARDAILARDFEALATVAERSCLRMHASAIAADPGILYWNPVTVDLIHRIREARATGVQVFFSIDAGPHIKAFCPSEEELNVSKLLRSTPGVLRTITTSPGPGARIVGE